MKIEKIKFRLNESEYEMVGLPDMTLSEVEKLLPEKAVIIEKSKDIEVKPKIEILKALETEAKPTKTKITVDVFEILPVIGIKSEKTLYEKGFYKYEDLFSRSEELKQVLNIDEKKLNQILEASKKEIKKRG